MSEKKCFKCGKVKPLSEFYRHPETSDGHLGKCKECTKADVAAHREAHPERLLMTRLKRCKKNPTKTNAHKAVESAIKAGAITRPNRCSGCGCSDALHRIEAHHYDYARPLDVIWLCTPCHRRMDMRRREVETAKE